MTMLVENITRRAKYNLMADEKLERLIESVVPFGKWGAFDKMVADLARHRKERLGGRMRDHQRVIARQLLSIMKKRKVGVDVINFELRAA
jgi:hypothetical protein